MTTRNQISTWFDIGLDLGATHMAVVVDTFDYEDYPVYMKLDPTAKVGTVREGRVLVTADIRSLIAERFDNINMQRLMECYNLDMDKEAQLSEQRAFHY